MYQQRVLSFLEFLNGMRGNYQQATFQQKRNALDVLGIRVAISPEREEQEEKNIWADCPEWIPLGEAIFRSQLSDTGIRRYIAKGTVRTQQNQQEKRRGQLLVHRDDLIALRKVVSPRSVVVTLEKLRSRVTITYEPLFVSGREEQIAENEQVSRSPHRSGRSIGVIIAP